MESASRPIHRNQSSSATFSKKLSNTNSFSAKNAYDDVFNGPPKFGAPTYSSRIEDYNEIFGGSPASRVSSIPILDLSALDEAKVSADVRSSKLDYSKIFGGFRDDDIAVSYEEMFAKPKGAKNFSNEARSPAKTASPSEGSDRLNSHKEEVFQYEAPNQSSEGMKQFNMSYHKTSQRSNDGTNGTTHVAQLRDVPGFTCFIDENHPLQKTEGDKSVPMSKADAKRLPKVDVNLNKKQTSDGMGKFKSQSSWDKFYSIDKSFSANENSLKTHPSKTSSPSSLPADFVSNKSEPKRSMDSNFKVPKRDASKAGPADCSPSFSDEEVDVNSEAAASAAALRKALEKAQASIRIAKELMERKKDGPQMFSKPNSKDGLDVRKRREDKVTVEGSRVRKKDATEICESADVVLHVFTKSERVKARRSGKVAPDFKESGEIFIAKEVVGETNGKKLESAEDCEALRHFSEPVSTAEHRTPTLACKHADGRNNIMLCGDTQECGRKEMETAEEILEQLDGNCKVVDEAQELKDLDWKLNAVKMAQDSAQEVHEQEENEKAGVAQEQEETEEKRKTSSGQEKCEKKLEESLEPNENKEFKSQEGKVNNNEGLDEAQECMENEKQEEEVFEEQDKLLKDVREEKECEKRVKEICQQDEIEERLQAACEWVDCKEVFEVESNEKRQNDADEGEDNEKRLDTVHELDINNKRLNGSTSDGEESEGRQEDNRDWEGKEKILLEACKYEETVSIQRKTNETAEVNQEVVKETMNLDACKWDAGESLSESLEAHRNKEKDNDLNFEENERISDVTQSSCQFIEDENGFEAVEVANSLGEKEICKTSGLVGGAAEHIEIENKMKKATEALLFDDNPANIGLNDMNSGPKQTDQNEKEPEFASNLKSGIMISMRESGEDEKKVEEDKIAFDVEEQKSNFDKAHEKRQWVEVGKKMEASQPPIVFKGEEKRIGTDEEIKASQSTEKSEENLNKTFAVEEKETKEWVEKGKTMEASQPPSVFRGEEKTVVLDEEIKTSQSTEKSEESEENLNKIFTVEEKETKEWVEMGKTIEASQPPSVFKGEEKTVVIDEEIKRSQITEKSEENLNKTFAVEEKETKEWVEMGKTMEASQPPSVFKGEEKTVVINEEIKTSQITEKSEENLNETFAVEERKAKEIAQIEVVEKERPTKNDEASKREREQEKDRMAVERAIREARERAFAEARERAERAAVERATAEARQRVMVEAREKFEKASAATKSSAEKASIETKLRAERAAVERATAEARERALEKALSQKATSGAREQAERFVAEKFSGVSRDNGMRQSFPSFDAQKLDGTNGESAQRCKARSDSHQTTMERAAKALAEKNMRDLLAQKEQAERNRLAETLDAEVKRWASGKERNLRALLSTLQYILGPDSGWQPVSLTDIITIDAVRKAYRKATLHVHPDKLQQRGANIQQKYICEKVFDLLKAAWNKFNPEER